MRKLICIQKLKQLKNKFLTFYYSFTLKLDYFSSNLYNQRCPEPSATMHTVSALRVPIQQPWRLEWPQGGQECAVGVTLCHRHSDDSGQWPQLCVSVSALQDRCLGPLPGIKSEFLTGAAGTEGQTGWEKRHQLRSPTGKSRATFEPPRHLLGKAP